ncbi:MAG TPA: diguanylate cyclase [Rhodanobacteraceae bacterium]|nr:diguanylate cyclase [Rhodanobacteraceae bacterium]
MQRFRPGIASWTVCAFAWAAGLFALPAIAVNPLERFHDYVRDNWSVENGLPQISVLTITQDSTGYIWLGTQNGIARFDGVRFSVYDRRTTGIDTTMATVSYTDRAGQPWFGTGHGVLRLNHGKFELLRAGNGNAAVQGIAESADGSMLFATSLGVMRLRDTVLEPAMLEGERTCSLLRDGETLWVGQTGTLARIDAAGISRFPLPPQAHNACITHIGAAAEAGDLWLGTTAGLYRWHEARVAPSGLDPELDSRATESLLRDHDGNQWFATAPTVFRLRPNGQLERVGEDDFVRDSWILSIFEDREGDLWFGSQTEGLFRLWDGWVKRVSRRDGLSDPFVWSVASDPQGRIVLGTNSNVAVSGPDGVKELVAGKRLPNPAAYDLFYDSFGRLWIGTRGGIAIFSHGELLRPPALLELDPFQINSIAQDGNDFWIGTSGGLYLYRNDKLKRIGAAPGQNIARVRSVYLVAPGELLVGTESGLRSVRGDAVTNPAWASILEGRMISYIAPVRDGVVGIATLDAGLGLLGKGKLTMVTVDQGLPSDNAWTFRTIAEHLYVAGIDGVWRIPVMALPDPGSAPQLGAAAQMVLSSSGRERGSQRVRCCNGGAQARSAVDAEGGMWLASISGALRLDTNEISYSVQPPTMVIEALRNGNRLHAPSAATLNLDEGSRDIQVDVTALSFRDPNSLRFRYRLTGYDADWIDAGARRSAFYTNLPPGAYRFEVQASLPDSAYGESQATVDFTLASRWYERASVRILLALLAALLIALLVSLRLRGYRAAQRRLEALVAERTRALSRANKRLHQANQVLAFESQTDPLTGLHNRRFLLDHAGELFDAERQDTTALLLLDLDHFKLINDRHGHAAGDLVLVQLARLLEHLAREGDHALRWGGEEFLVVVKAVAAEQALEIGERIRLAVARHTFSTGAGRTLHVTCSIGVSLHPLRVTRDQQTDWSMTLELADAGLYRVKQEGRNGTIGLFAGPGLTQMNPNTRSAATIDALLASDALRWQRPSGTPQLRVVQ